jgi:hypothetical protein
MKTRGMVLCLAVAAILLTPFLMRGASFDYLTIGPGDLRPCDNVLKYTCSEQYLSPKNSSLGTNAFVASVHLPTDAKVSNLWLVYEDSSDIERIHVYWYRKNLTSGAVDLLASYETKDSAAGVRRININPTAAGKGAINNGNCTYSVKVVFSDGLTKLKFYALRFFYTL